MEVKRLLNNPIISPGMDKQLGGNINGPSLIRVPNWINNPLGKYYLYFASHNGTYIRMAYSHRLKGPWAIYKPGVLPLAKSFCKRHIASPDVHVDNEAHQIRMYYHGGGPTRGHQVSRVALSADGLNFKARPDILGRPYFRVFQWSGYYYAIAKPGALNRSADGLTSFEQGPRLFEKNMRHSALKLDGDVLSVFYSNVSDCPECILLAKIQLAEDWMEWQVSAPEVVLKPETDYEGANLPNEPSRIGYAATRVRQLRDPAVFKENGRTYLLYTVSGEYGIAIAEIFP